MKPKHWLLEEDYKKALFHLRTNAESVFDFLKVDDKIPIRYMYGTGVYVHGAVDEIIKLAEDFSLVTRGEDKPISIERIRRKRR